MTASEPTLVKRVVRLPDGRRLVFYDFPDRAPGDPPARRDPPERPPDKEP